MEDGVSLFLVPKRTPGVEVRLVDERYSSLEAGSRLKAERESGVRKRRVTKTDVDAAAACVILERWFFDSTNEY